MLENQEASHQDFNSTPPHSSFRVSAPSHS